MLADQPLTRANEDRPAFAARRAVMLRPEADLSLIPFALVRLERPKLFRGLDRHYRSHARLGTHDPARLLSFDGKLAGGLGCFGAS